MNFERYKTVSEKELQVEWMEIQAAQKNPLAFSVLYDRYYYQIFKFIIKRTANEDLTAELCSLVFLKALRELNSFKFRGVPFSAWLFRIASNEVGQHFRKAKLNRVVSIEDTNLQHLSEEVETEFDERYKELMIEVLDELDEQDLELIELRFFEQLPFKEIAEIFQITESNAKVRTYRILERMKKKILHRVDPH